VLDVRLIRKSFGSVEEAAKYSPAPAVWEHVSRPSPDMKPVPMPISSPRAYVFSPSSLLTDDLNAVRDSALGTPPPSSTTTTDTTPPSFHTAQDASNTPTLSTISHREATVSSSNIQVPEQVDYTPSRNPTLQTFDTISPAFKVTAPSSRTSSLFSHTPSTSTEESPVGVQVPEYDGYASPPPADERIAEQKNEQRYRILLSHQFHRSCQSLPLALYRHITDWIFSHYSVTLPLWAPTPVDLGAVGYLSKPSGTFVTLFDAFCPGQSSNGTVKSMPSLYGYGRITKGSQRKDERNAAQRGIDAFVGMLAFKSRGGFPVS
jgi:hypothetical protein